MVFGRIYQIVEKTNPDFCVYVGSTIQTFGERWSKHKSHCCGISTHLPQYAYMNSLGGPEKF